jgi:hypothetical protein
MFLKSPASMMMMMIRIKEGKEMECTFFIMEKRIRDDPVGSCVGYSTEDYNTPYI